MTVFDCSLRESFQVGRDIRLQITGRVDEVLYVFIDTAARHELGGVGGFHASAPSGIGRIAHVLALRDADCFTIGQVSITIEAVRLRIPDAQALRQVRLRIDMDTTPVQVTREAIPRKPGRLQCLRVEGASC